MWRLLTGLLLLVATALVQASDGSTDTHPGKALFLDRQAGNCLACHQLDDGRGGNLGPALINLQQRYSERHKLYEQIADARKRNPDSIMPPFGAHGILTPAQLRAITDFLYEQ